MLVDAGVEHEVLPADIDEAGVKADGENPEDLALKLAEAKALAVSGKRPDDWVVGSDSIVTVDGRRFDKPASREEAVEHLSFFSGKPMKLTSAVVLARGGSVDWSRVGQADLAVRTLSNAFIDFYLDAEWPGVGQTVGVFRMEGRGIQLFESVAGGHFTILGMPLLPLLKALREREVLRS